MSVAAGKGATFAAKGGQLSGCAMRREIEHAAIATDCSAEKTDEPWRRTGGTQMRCPRYEVVSSWKPFFQQHDDKGVHTRLDGRGSA